MRSVVKVLPALALGAGAMLAAYGGYGAGVAHAVGGSLAHWLQVAGLLAGGLGLTGFGVWKGRPRSDNPPASFAADLAALERLVPTVRKHPDGLSTLQDLIEVLFEACHRTDAPGTRDASVARSRTGGRANA